MNNGYVFLIDKPEGISSFDVIRKLRRITSVRKMGHTGTLDPFASGLLPICVGKATRVASFLASDIKTYSVIMDFGYKTDTGDRTGNIIETNLASIPEQIDFSNLSKSVLSITEQIPPKYSAIKIDGKRAYKLARKNEDFEMKPRKIEIHDFKIISYEDNKLSYSTTVGKGTYIRSLSETIAEKLGSIAYTSMLRRTAIGNIRVSEAVKLSDIDEDNWDKFSVELPSILIDFPKLVLTDAEIKDFSYGKKISSYKGSNVHVMVLDKNNNCVGFAYKTDKGLKPDMVFI